MAKKTKVLVNLIREVVKQEVKKQMTDIFINEGKKAVVTKSNNGFDVPDILPKPKEQKTYVKDPVLNNILNETAHSQEMDEYPTMGGGTFDTSKMAEALGYGNMLGNAESQRQASAIQTAQAVGADTSNPAVQDVMSNLTKDYRGVMAALDKKDGKK